MTIPKAPKHNRIRKAGFKDQKYRDSFKKHRAHKCILTGQEWTEYSSECVVACHITIGRHGLGMKDDHYILPLINRLHAEFDKNQEKFIEKHFDEFPYWMRREARNKLIFSGSGSISLSNVKIVKQIAKGYYQNWLAML